MQNQVKKKAFGKKAAPLSESDCTFFVKGAMTGFKYIAQRHSLTAVQMWREVEAGLKKVGMHTDDLADVQLLVFGWKPLTAEMLERYRWRYPDRCPLLDVLCTMDDTCEELNKVQDWMLELKGAKDRRRLELLPSLVYTASRPVPR